MDHKFQFQEDQYSQKQLEEGIERCDENVRIFNEEIEKQKLLKLDLQYKLASIKARSPSA